MHRHRPTLRAFMNAKPIKTENGLSVVRCPCRDCKQLVQVSPKVQKAYEIIGMLCQISYPLISILILFSTMRPISWRGPLILILVGAVLFLLLEVLFWRFAPFVLVPDCECIKSPGGIFGKKKK